MDQTPPTLTIHLELDLATNDVRFQAPVNAPRFLLYGMLDMAREILAKQANQPAEVASPIIRPAGPISLHR